MSKEKYFDKYSDTISIGKFVNCYLGIDADCRNLRHMGLKSLESPYEVGISNAYADKNPEYVKNGMILLVLDSRGDRASYINPVVLKKLASGEEDNLQKIIRTSKIHSFNELSEFHKAMQVLMNQLEIIDIYSEFISDVGKEEAVQKIKCLKTLCH